MAEKEAPAEAPAAPRKKGKLLFIIAVPLLLALGGAGGWWMFGRDEDPAAEAKAPPPKPPVFVPLDQFTVNLIPENGQQQYAQIGLNLKVAGQETADAIKHLTPEIRNRILLLISNKRASELITLSGKQQLAADIKAATMAVISPEPPGKTKPAAKPPVTVAKAEQATQTDATEPAEPEAADEPPEEPGPKKKKAAKPAADGPNFAVIEILFTAFIIQ